MADMKDFVIENGTLIKYIGNESNAIIPDNVTKIGVEAFKDYDKLTGITIPHNVTGICREAFKGCTNLLEVTLHEGITFIGEKAFMFCGDLTHITIPNSVTEIWDNAFWCCSNLTEVVLSKNLTEIGNGAFRSTGLIRVEIPENVKDIGNSAFSECRKLTEVILPYGIESIGTGAFKSCTELKSIILPDSITNISSDAFLGCNSLESISIPAGIRNIWGSIFDECNNLSTITINTRYFDDHSLKSLLYEITGLKKIILHRNTKITQKQLSKSMRSKVKPAIIILEGLKSKEPIPSALTGFDKLQFDLTDLAYIMLYQKDPIWQTWAQEKMKKLKKNDMKSLEDTISRLTTENPDTLSQPLQLMQDISVNQKAQRSAEAENISKTVLSKTRMNDLMTWAKNRSLLMDKIGRIRMAGSEEIAPVEAVLFVLNKYMTQMYRLPAYKQSTYKTAISSVYIVKEADEIAEHINKSDMFTLLEKPVEAICNGTVNEDISFLNPYCRYAELSDIKKIIEASERLVRSRNIEERRIAIALRSAVLLNDSLPAAQFIDSCGHLSYYARERGMSEQVFRTRLMADSGKEITVTRQFDLGDTMIEAKLEDDLTISLFDTAKGKKIRSMPKGIACAAAFGEFKTDLTNYIKQRAELLHSLHMSGEYLDQETWQKGFMEHPAAVLLTQLLVWQDSTGVTFMTVDGNMIRANDQPYIPNGNIRMAHVMDMPKEDSATWQKWLVRNARKQLFEQVWEPVIPWKKREIKKRYQGTVITDKDRNKLRKSLVTRGIPFGYKEKKYHWEDEYQGVVSDDPDVMRIGKSTELEYTLDRENKILTLIDFTTSEEPGSREMNAILLELDKATISSQVARDNDAAINIETLSEFTAAQISSLLNWAIDNKAEKCTALLLNYKNEHFPEYANIDEFSLDW